MALIATADPGSFAVLVVCDGVSSSADPDVASLAAARAAREVLASPLPGTPSLASRIHAWTARFGDAVAAAQKEAVAAARVGEQDDGVDDGDGAAARAMSPPSCTFVAAVADGPVIVAGWVGDSRAYWLPDAGPAEQLSIDDSWATEAIAAGLSREEAESSRQAHAITRWLGLDSVSHEPRCVSAQPAGPGWLLVCSDGLWNYCSPAADVAALVADKAAGAGGDPVKASVELVAWANEQGGHDNITVTLARIPGPGASTTPSRTS